MAINANKVGLVLGTFAGLWHLFWCFLVAMGLAQPLLDWIYRLHSLNDPFHVAAFDVLTGIELILITFAGGYAFGWSLAMLWNTIHSHDELPQGRASDMGVSSPVFHG